MRWRETSQLAAANCEIFARPACVKHTMPPRLNSSCHSAAKRELGIESVKSIDVRGRLWIAEIDRVREYQENVE